MAQTRRGGRRQGRPGEAYDNRTDLNAGPRTQAVTAAPDQEYGQRGELEDAQRAVPLPAAAPGPLIPLGAPTERPEEPLTAGLPFGPGAGPDALGLGPPQDDTLTRLRALFRVAPSDDLGRLIAEAEEDGRT